MEARLGNVVAVARRANSGNVANVLDHGGEGERHDRDDGGNSQARIKPGIHKAEHRVLHQDGQTDPIS